jgi:hypothetical protein
MGSAVPLRGSYLKSGDVNLMKIVRESKALLSTRAMHEYAAWSLCNGDQCCQCELRGEVGRDCLCKAILGGGRHIGNICRHKGC